MGCNRHISPPPPPNMNVKYFTDNLSRVIDLYSKDYDRIIVMGDFNLEPTDKPIEFFCNSYHLYNLVKEKTCIKGQPKCYDLMLTTGFSDFHKMTISIMKTQFMKADPIQIDYSDYKNYNPLNLIHDLSNKSNTDDTVVKNYNRFQNVLCNVLDKHAPMKKKSCTVQCIRQTCSYEEETLYCAMY